MAHAKENPCTCISTFESWPVCGSDGVTYRNPGYLDCRNICNPKLPRKEYIFLLYVILIIRIFKMFSTCFGFQVLNSLMMANALNKLKHNVLISDFILYSDLIFILKRQNNCVNKYIKNVLIFLTI